MRHRVARTKLNRDKDHRKMLLRNLSAALFLHEKIETTHAKAKYLQPYAEELITKAIKATKDGDKIKQYNAYKQFGADIHSGDAVKKLLGDISKRFAQPTGGYTRIVRTRNRKGDNSQLARIELTTKAPKEKKSKNTAKAAKKPEGNSESESK